MEERIGRLAGTLNHDECAPWCDHDPIHHEPGCTDSFCDSYKCWDVLGLERPDFSVKRDELEAEMREQSPIPISSEFPDRMSIPTPAEMRKLRKQYVTVKYSKVIACGHSLDLSRPPRHRNCEFCIVAWFNYHGELIQQLDEMHTAGGDELIIQMQGIKFYKSWRKFMSTVAKFAEEESDKN